MWVTDWWWSDGILPGMHLGIDEVGFSATIRWTQSGIRNCWQRKFGGDSVACFHFAGMFWLNKMYVLWANLRLL